MGKPRFTYNIDLSTYAFSTIANEVELPRDVFLKMVEECWEFSDPALLDELRTLASTATRVGWGFWVAKDTAERECRCPVASVSRLEPGVDNTALDASKSGHARWDRAMCSRTGFHDGIATITD